MNGILHVDGAARRTATPDKIARKRVNHAGRPTASELDRRKQRVMEVATELFVNLGFAATSLGSWAEQEAAG